MNRRTIQKLGEVIVVLAVALVVAVAAAQAASDDSAKLKAAKLQANDCKWGNPLLYSCSQRWLLFPACHATGIDAPGKPQHVCGGLFVRKHRLSGALQFCYTTYFLSPWNAELYGSGYKCYATPLSASDAR